MCVHPLPLAGAEKVMAAVAVQLAGWWARCGHTNMCSGDQVAVLLKQIPGDETVNVFSGMPLLTISFYHAIVHDNDSVNAGIKSACSST